MRVLTSLGMLALEEAAKAIGALVPLAAGFGAAYLIFRKKNKAPQTEAQKTEA